ncbi:MAG: hypothetical protein JW944_03395 [Deltaproteobacteria bacterium]|nr:hypothetical protein [Deltaproteobacteria bacterium]
MSPGILTIDGKKFMWDGVKFTSKEEILDTIQKYKREGFEVETFEEGENIFLYTRRVVKEVVVTQ